MTNLLRIGTRKVLRVSLPLDVLESLPFDSCVLRCGSTCRALIRAGVIAADE